MYAIFPPFSLKLNAVRQESHLQDDAACRIFYFQ